MKIKYNNIHKYSHCIKIWLFDVPSARFSLDTIVFIEIWPMAIFHTQYQFDTVYTHYTHLSRGSLFSVNSDISKRFKIYVLFEALNTDVSQPKLGATIQQRFVGTNDGT